jgi:hypothetical protein
MSVGTRLLSIGSITSALIGGSLLHPVVTGQVAHTTHQGAPIGTGLVPTAGAFVALALLLGFVAYREHIPAVDRLLSSPRTHRVATIAVVGLVISTAALAGFGGPASPVETVQAGYFEGCDFSDSMTLAIGASLGMSNQDCTFWTPDQNVDNITAVDIEANAVAASSSHDTFLNTQENFANDRRSVAWAKAKISLVNDLNNNVSEQNATDNAQEVVNDYYTTSQKNILADWHARAEQWGYWVNASTDGTHTTSSEGFRLRGSGEQEAYVEMGDITYTLANGNTSQNISAPLVAPDWNTNDPIMVVPSDSQSGYTVHSAPANLGPTDNDHLEYNGSKVLDPTRTSTLLAEIETQRSQVNSNLATYANETYQAYNSGEINATDIVSSDPTTLATQAATDYNSTGYYGLASAQLAAMGLSGDNNVSHVVNTTENGSARTISGTLFYTGEDDQSFDTGTQYDPSTLNGSVYMSVASIKDGNGSTINKSSGFYHVNENFTISQATNTQTGESVNTTSMQTRNYTSTNVSLLADEIDRLKEQRAFYEQQSSAAAGGSSSSNTILIAAIALAAGAALMWRRDQNN